MPPRHRNRFQLGLPLDPEVGELSEDELRVAHRRAGLRQSFERAMDNPALAICLRNLALELKRGRTR